MTAKPARAAIDVSELPTEVFGSRATLWWGTMGFVVIEGITLVICAVSYFYLRENFREWPPAGTPVPRLLIPTINALLMLASVAPAVWVRRRAEELDRRGVQIGLVILTLLNVAFLVLRWFEFRALNTRWDSDAYGSVVWVTLGFHATLLAVELAELAGMTALAFSDRMEPKHFPDTADAVDYWFFMVGSWILLYLMIWFTPRLV